MRLAASLLLLYIGFVAGSLQVLAFKDKWEGLGVVIGITIFAILILAIRTSMRMQQPVKSKTIPKRANVARSSKAAKSKMKVVNR